MQRRLRLLALLAAALFAVLATAQLATAADAPFASGDAKAGAAMHEKDCVACHVRRVGGDGTTMYTRPDRKVTSAAKLRAQVAACNTELGAGYFPEDEDHVAAYLNLQFYKFKE